MVSITQRDDSTHEKTEMITTEIDVTRLENAVYVIERDMLNTYIKHVNKCTATRGKKVTREIKGKDRNTAPRRKTIRISRTADIPEFTSLAVQRLNIEENRNKYIKYTDDEFERLEKEKTHWTLDERWNTFKSVVKTIAPMMNSKDWKKRKRIGR
ncbi:hypothetical protein QE152_g9441 [Popillia japonica]|uniref:Uncharacterized protein n=1 Tax=Popillia japonica TaxID=7064 RepID=A0AAW1LUZ2_POPJA